MASGDLARRESVRNFRKFVGENLPPDQAQRVWQLLESVVFIASPNLAGTMFYETRTGDGPPSAVDYEQDGIGFYVDESAGEAYTVLKWQDIFYVVGSGGGGTPGTGDHSELTNLDADDHEQYILGDRPDWIDLTDAGETALHTHAGISGGPWLPLAAGAGNGLLDRLYIYNAGKPGVYMREEGVVDAAFIYNDPAMPTCLVGGQRLTGISYLDLHSYAIDGVSDCIIRALRYALTTGVETGFVIFKADGTDTEQHTLLAKGDAKLCQDAGDLRLGGNMYVTLPTTQPADIELANGQAVFWIQE